MKKIAIIYDSFPHYRAGVIRCLTQSKNYTYMFFGSSKARDITIKSFDFDKNFIFQETHIIETGPFALQLSLATGLINKSFHACIFLGNPYFISYWAIAPLLKLTGVKVYFWTHGWLSTKENALKRLFRNTFFKLADGLFLYGERAREIGINQGFNANSLHVINNSLDYSLQKTIFNQVQKTDRYSLCSELGASASKNIIICSARLTPKCRFDLLLNAIHQLQENTNTLIQVILIGDGPEKETLSVLANELSLDVIFWGACYDEMTLCKLYTISDVAVSPGKVGLTAMHSMAYGTPVISHNNFDTQMPEYESIIPGFTGDFFEENSAEDLTRVIQHWLTNHPIKPVDACIEQIEKFYTPEFQRSAIESVLLKNEK